LLHREEKICFENAASLEEMARFVLDGLMSSKLRAAAVIENLLSGHK
jgi:hypothetical protein